MYGTNGASEMKVSAFRMFLTLLGLAGLCLAQRSSLAQEAGNRVIVANVYLDGVRNVPIERALLELHTKPGREYSQAEAYRDIDRLAASGLCRPLAVKTVATSDGRVDVIFVVKEHRSVVREVIFKHARLGDIKEMKNLTRTRIRRGMPLNKELNQLACFEIQDYLKKQGHYFANVSLEEGQNDGDTRVVFNITEGPKVRVRSVEFTGQKELASSARLRTQIETSRSFLQTWGGTFNPAVVDHDVVKLSEYYRNNGYHKINVSRELHFSADMQYVDIVYHIQEGERFRVYDAGVIGSKNHTVEQLSSFLTIKKGEFFNAKSVNDDVRNLTDYIGYRGYMADVRELITEVPEQPGFVRVQYVVEDKPMAYVGQVIIVGNTVTQERVIRRMLEGIQPGQVLRYPELRAAERDLARLSIFEMKPELGIRPTVQALDTPGPFKDILVKVQETRTGSFMLGAGLNSSSGLVGNIVLNERNFDLFRYPTSLADLWEGRAFRGAGQEFRIEAMPGTAIQRYTVSVREPYLFDRPYSLLTSAYYRDRIFNEYTEGRLGGRVNLGHQFTKEWGASVGFRAEDVNVRNVAAFAPPDYTSVLGHSSIFAPGVTVAWDTRDSFLRPTEGGRVEFSYEQVFGSNSFPILNAEASRYFTLWQRPDGSGKHVVVARTQMSWAGDDAPVYERFFAGGYMSLRGFQFRGIGPNTGGFMVGGRFQWINTLEYQIPIRANDNLYFVAFLDSGTVENNFGINDYRVSAGFGLRISVPMMGPVPIALDFGFPIVKSSTDITQLFTFGVGIYR
ncbi:MAG: BamA/TamA family outer membrane protein [Planctomycetes bacterium]|nr:BamA/TamA family outer membrane protein [Planctomycetota bacterium]